ncbi:endonuclease [Lentibacter phage vB_LenP_ICBM1]|uniref:Endonuclease n=1 Tax=Lentibacter phage vB_LenP_ICBM1 TaxID=2847822 RepID=A0A3G2YRL4_9CAUD|nr:endonuclease [Lentibacter phage vB_LenP_ICBM1]AYP28137.2 endonuclease [Lentibacter phage vB_LenP_ICBM1]
MNSKSSTRKRALKAGYRSGLEEQTAKDLKKREVPFSYEERKIKWLDSKIRTYTPDFELPNGVIIETKGRFVAADRRKHLEIKKQFGDKYDIRFVFTNSKAKLYKGAKSSYADWCNKHGFLYADKTIPEEWLNE